MNKIDTVYDKFQVKYIHKQIRQARYETLLVKIGLGVSFLFSLILTILIKTL